MNFEKLLDELYDLTKIQQQRELTVFEKNRYMELVNVLHANNIEIDFGIEY